MGQGNAHSVAGAAQAFTDCRALQAERYGWGEQGRGSGASISSHNTNLKMIGAMHGLFSWW